MSSERDQAAVDLEDLTLDDFKTCKSESIPLL